MPDHFREPLKTMGPRSPGSDHSHPLSLVVKSGDEANNLVHKKRVVENKLISSRSPQLSTKFAPSSIKSDSTSGFSSDGSGENRTSLISVYKSANRERCTDETEQPQDFSVERFIEDSTSNIKKRRHSFRNELGRQKYDDWVDRKQIHETKRAVDDNIPLPLVSKSNISKEQLEISGRSTSYSKSSSGYTSPSNDDSGHDGEMEDNLETSGSPSPVLQSSRYLSNTKSIKSGEQLEPLQLTLQEGKEIVIPEVVLERKVNNLIHTNCISPPTEEEAIKRNKILPNVTIEKVVSKEEYAENVYSRNRNASSNNILRTQEENKQHGKVTGIKIKEFARFDTDVVDAAEMERKLLGPVTKYEQTLAALTGTTKRTISIPTCTRKSESLANEENATAKSVEFDKSPRFFPPKHNNTIDERYKTAEEDIDIHSEVSSIDTWISGASHRSFAKKGEITSDNISGRINQGDTAYPCTYCDKLFSNSYHLTSHLVTHTGERSFSCPMCEKTFGRRSTLRAHMTTHSKTSNFMCPVCEKACNDNNSLEEHIRMHTGEKPFICTVCNKAYARKSHLSVHYRVHTGERPFVCVDCGKDFTEKRFLNDHMQTSHSGVAGGNDSGPLKCPNCYREFAYKTSLKQHLKKQMCVRNLARDRGNSNFQGNHTKQFACPFCDKSYSWKQTLKQHVSMYHRNKVHTDEFWKYEMAKHRRTVVDDKDRNDDMWQQQLGRHGTEFYEKLSFNNQSYNIEYPQVNNSDPGHDERWLQQIKRATSMDSNKKSEVPTEMKMLALQSLNSSLHSLNSIYTSRSNSTEGSHYGSMHHENVGSQQTTARSFKNDIHSDIAVHHSEKSPNHLRHQDTKDGTLLQYSNKLPQQQDDNYLSLLAHISAQRKACEEEKQDLQQHDKKSQEYQKELNTQTERNGNMLDRDNLENEFHFSQKSESLSFHQQRHRRSLSTSPPTLSLPDIKEESSVTRTKMWLAQLGQYRQKAVQEELEKNHDELWEEQISRAKLNPVKSPIEPLEITIEDESNAHTYEQKKSATMSSKCYELSKIGTDDCSMSTEYSSSMSPASLFVSKQGTMKPLISALQVQQQTSTKVFKMISESNPTTKDINVPHTQHNVYNKLPSRSPLSVTTDSEKTHKYASLSPALNFRKVAPPAPPVSPVSPNPPNTQVQQQISFNSLLNIKTSTIVNINGQNIQMGSISKTGNDVERNGTSMIEKSPHNQRISVSIPIESNNNNPSPPLLTEPQFYQENPINLARHIPLAIPPLQPTSHLPPIAKHKQPKMMDIDRNINEETSAVLINDTAYKTNGSKPKYPPPDPKSLGSSSVLKMLLLEPTKRKRPSTPPVNYIPNKRSPSSQSDHLVNLHDATSYVETPRETPNMFNRFSGAPNTSDETDILRRRLLGIKASPTPSIIPSKSGSMILPKPRYSRPSATITSADAAEKEAVLQRKSPMAVEEFTKVAAAAVTLASFNLSREMGRNLKEQDAASVKIIKKVDLPLEFNYQKDPQDISRSLHKPHKQQLLSTHPHLDSMYFEEDLSAPVNNKSVTNCDHPRRNTCHKYCNEKLVKEECMNDKLSPYTKRDETANDEDKTPRRDAETLEVNRTPTYAKTSVLKHLLYRYTTHSANNQNNNSAHADQQRVINLNDHANNNNNATN